MFSSSCSAGVAMFEFPPAMTAPSLTMPIAFSNSTYRMECTQPLGVKAAVDSVTTTGRCTSAHSGMDTWRATFHAVSLMSGRDMDSDVSDRGTFPEVGNGNHTLAPGNAY